MMNDLFSWKQNIFHVTIMKIKFPTGLRCQLNLCRQKKAGKEEVRESET